MCKTPVTPSLSRNRAVTLAVSVVAPVLVLAILVLTYLIWRAKRKLNTSSTDLAMVPELRGAPGHITNHWDHLQEPENRRFTYQELEKFTDNFKHLIGHGGFGHVYYGCLEDSTEVAIKMRSELSSHGLDQFLAEVQSLTKVHHRNLVCLVGYCWEKEHLALVYEYMSRGNLCDYLRDVRSNLQHNNYYKYLIHGMTTVTRKIGMGENLNWKTRVRVALEAAQGLDYLHKGCNLPIIHGDMKTNNILLGQNFKAKIADFGTHISAVAAGSMGYIDSEYYTTGRLTESSDVYSFGIVLLEITTGEPPIIPEKGHIVQRVKKKIVSGNISSVADAHLGGAYNVSSMWKVVNIAMMCTTDIATQRPKMADVVVQLKESLDLVEVQGDRGDKENLASDTMSSMSTFEVTIGELPIIPGNGHIIQHMMQIVTGNITSVADERLGGSYIFNSMWKVLDAMMMCITDIASQRLMMSAVVLQLKENHELEEAHGDGLLGKCSHGHHSQAQTFVHMSDRSLDGKAFQGDAGEALLGLHQQRQAPADVGRAHRSLASSGLRLIAVSRQSKILLPPLRLPTKYVGAFGVPRKKICGVMPRDMHRFHCSHVRLTVSSKTLQRRRRWLYFVACVEDLAVPGVSVNGATNLRGGSDSLGGDASPAGGYGSAAPGPSDSMSGSGGNNSRHLQEYFSNCGLMIKGRQKTIAQRRRRAPLAVLRFSVIVPSAAGWADHKPCQTDLPCCPVLRIKDIKQGALA
uniref:Leucine-rich repeat protein kinase-like n=1 Tax=Oryza sativa subsp. japonica TaxID=39947 RepID=Q6ERN2_ORYSJ|nr:leucine-rich repeat protein kinase-like [Oryza sativa Japonica Group]